MARNVGLGTIMAMEVDQVLQRRGPAVRRLVLCWGFHPRQLHWFEVNVDCSERMDGAIRDETFSTKHLLCQTFGDSKAGAGVADV